MHDYLLTANSNLMSVEIRSAFIGQKVAKIGVKFSNSVESAKKP